MSRFMLLPNKGAVEKNIYIFAQNLSVCDPRTFHKASTVSLPPELVFLYIHLLFHMLIIDLIFISHCRGQQGGPRRGVVWVVFSKVKKRPVQNRWNGEPKKEIVNEGTRQLVLDCSIPSMNL